MKHSICVIDDSIPANNHPTIIDDTQLLPSYILRYLLSDHWTDANVKNLVELIIESEHFDLFAFRNPTFLFNHSQNNVLLPDIIIFDWDYDGGTESSETLLLRLLKTFYSIVYVYTGVETHDDIETILNSADFAPYSHRLKTMKKSDENSVEMLLTEANDKYEGNFSYRFGRELKQNAIKAMDEILIEISKLSYNEFWVFFGSKIGNSYHISTLDLVSIISEKFKHQLLDQKFSHETEKVINENEHQDDDLVKKVWGYRLYHTPTDKIVRKGDIIMKKGKDDSILYLVISSDCHMNNFWNKNFGSIALIPLFKLFPNNNKIKEKFKANRSGKLNGFSLTSLTNPNSIQGITILPGILDTQGNYVDYLLDPKMVFTVNIKLPQIRNIDNEKYQLPLLYNYWKSYIGKKRIRVSEPFLSPLMQFIMENITGYGCPDFSHTLQTKIKASFNNARQ